MSAAFSSNKVALALCTPLIFGAAPVKADPFTAITVMQKMSSAERFAFVAGIVEGLAISRYAQDGKKPDGMNCIYDWFYKDVKTVDNIYTAFEHFPEYPPGSVVEAMARKTCN